MRYWDSSAVVPLLIDEASSATVEASLREDPEITAWWGTSIECASAIGRRERSGAMDSAEATRALTDLGRLAAAWAEIPPSERVRDLALRLVRVHDLRAGDALQLAAALAASEERPETLDLVTFDDRLALAASREGFHVLPT